MRPSCIYMHVRELVSCPDSRFFHTQTMTSKNFESLIFMDRGCSMISVKKKGPQNLLLYSIHVLTCRNLQELTGRLDPLFRWLSCLRLCLEATTRRGLTPGRTAGGRELTLLEYHGEREENWVYNVGRPSAIGYMYYTPKRELTCTSHLGIVLQLVVSTCITDSQLTHFQ